MNNLTKEENEMKRHNILNFPRMIAAVMLAFASSQAPAAEEAGFNAGIVTCKSIPGTTVNLLIHSSTQLNCTFKRAEGGTENYAGESGIGLGLALSWNKISTMRYSVVTATNDKLGPGALGGKYVGGQASAAFAVGLGAAVLVGGGADNIALQPLAIETIEGLDASAGIGYLFLKAK